MLATFVTVSQVREANDKTLELMLSLPLPRAFYFIGRLLGFLACALVLACLVALPLLFYAPAPAVAAWGCTLFFELSIVAAASLFCVLSLNQITASLAAVVGFYLLSRTLAALLLIGTSSSLDSATLGSRIIAVSIRAISYLMPRLDLYTQTGWLLQPVTALPELGGLALQTVAYVVVLAGAATVDLYRKNF
jgi:ABC-type transport system involved in multi-copper enzyme maturation permease subunit